MTKKKRTIRVIVNSVLLVAIVALGITVYQTGNERREQKEQAQQQELLEQNQETAKSEKGVQEEESLVDVGTSEVEAQLNQEDSGESAEETADLQASSADTEAVLEAPEDTVMEEPVNMEESTQTAVVSQVNFTEDTLMVWPLAGDVLLDYSMDQTIYHPTLQVYKYNPGIAISAVVDAPVLAAANGTVEGITEDVETGTTITVDMGNGYRAIYGQLQNLQVQEGQIIGESTILGYIAEPTKYYSVEGSNLYFAMTKDGKPIDPISYLP